MDLHTLNADMETTTALQEDNGTQRHLLPRHLARFRQKELLAEAITKQSETVQCDDLELHPLKYVAENSHGFGKIAPGFLWTNIEPDIAIVCACLPAMMPLVRLVRDKLSSRFALSRTCSSKRFSQSESQWPRSKDDEIAADTDRDGFTHLVDRIELTNATSWAWRGELPDDEVVRSAEEGLVIGKVHVRNEVDVSLGRI